MATTDTTRYEIVTLDEAGQWVSDQVGDPNVFTTREEAEAAIVELRKLGEDWAEAEYDVREIDAEIAPGDCPPEWAGKARRVSVETGDAVLTGWELTENIEGYLRAGQLWFDGNDDSTEPAPSWVIEPDSY